MSEKPYLGIDVGGTSVKLGIVDRRGAILVSGSFGLHDNEILIPAIQTILRGTQSFLDEHGIAADSLAGIGVCAPGLIDSANGCVAGTGANIPGWAGTKVRSQLEQAFRLPVSLAGDGNCALLAEHWIGAARGYTDVVCVTIGTGVGGGVLTGGHLLEGSHGFGGQIGHFPTHAWSGEVCACGLDGCFERYASASALVRQGRSANPAWKDGLSVFQAAANGSAAAIKLLKSWIDEIAVGIAGLVHIFDPQLVLIGGGVSVQHELMIEPLQERVFSMIMPAYRNGLCFRAAELKNTAGFIGAVYYHLLARR